MGLRQLQETLRARCRGSDAVGALNAYAAAKASITSLREAFRQDEISAAGPPDEFVNLAGSARAELDLHAEGLASLEEAVASLCERGIDFPSQAPARANGVLGNGLLAVEQTAYSPRTQRTGGRLRSEDATRLGGKRITNLV